MRFSAAAVLVLVCSGAVGLNLPVRAGIEMAGYNPVTLALGGVRTLSFEDPSILLSNPSGISAGFSGNMYSVAYGPVIMSADYSDAAGSHSNSWTTPLGCSSGGMRIPVLERLTLGLAVAATSVIPFRTIYQIPPYSSKEPQQNSPGETEIEGYTGEVGIGAAWDATNWLTIGAAGFWRNTSQKFQFSSGFIDSLEYGSSEYFIKAGITVPLEPAIFAVSWSPEGNYTDSRLTLGGKVRITDVLEAGAEIDNAVLDARDLQTGRVFASFQTSSSLTLRGGLFYTSRTEEVSPQGVGFSCGGGFTTGRFLINLGLSVFPVRGEFDRYGYTEMTSYQGTGTVVSAGVVLSP